MGCDIHATIEYEKYPGMWFAFCEEIDLERDYRRFSQLAGVRANDSTKYPRPKGFPERAYTSEAQEKFEEMGGHTPSWATREEWDTATAEREGDGYHIVSQIMRLLAEAGRASRVVYWFDS